MKSRSVSWKMAGYEELNPTSFALFRGRESECSINLVMPCLFVKCLIDVSAATIYIKTCLCGTSVHMSSVMENLKVAMKQLKNNVI